MSDTLIPFIKKKVNYRKKHKIMTMATNVYAFDAFWREKASDFITCKARPVSPKD